MDRVALKKTPVMPGRCLSISDPAQTPPTASSHTFRYGTGYHHPTTSRGRYAAVKLRVVVASSVTDHFERLQPSYAARTRG